MVNRIVHFLSLCVVANGYIALPSHHVSKNLKTPPSSRRSTQLHSLYENHPHWPDDASSSEEYSNQPIFYNDFDLIALEQESESQFWENSSAEDQSSSIPANLRPTRTSDTSISDFLNARISQVTKDSRRLLRNWRHGRTKSYGAFTINEQYLLNQEENKEDADPDSKIPFDWVRRVDIGQYPRVACGSAHGSIFVADATSKQVMGVARGVHYSEQSDEYTNALDEQLRQYIYGEYDGGGVLDVAMFGKNIVASAGREGGVKLFKLLEDGNQAELLPQGDVKALIRLMPGALPIVVTCMKFDSYGRLYLGCSDGFLRIVHFPQDFIFGDGIDLDSQDLHVTVVPHWSDQAPSPILSLDVSEELEMVVTSHANGNVCLYSMKEHEDVYNMASGRKEHVGVIGVWNPFTADKSYARSVTFTSKDSMHGPKHAVVVGGGNGEVWVNDIYPEYEESKSGEVFVDDYTQKFEPNHVGPVISLCSRPEGLIVSVGHDGMLRMTQTWIGLKNPKKATPWPLYGLGGYKAWIGSVCVDDEGKRLISDGMDDAVIVHDFSEYEKEEKNQ
mmetsp:Transcript_24175/g.34587  ORF Transcript_24175/g.34587 Transcript_24175/m.34587 type:complete len:560 (-) Transcript_24175:132-1811(-)